MVVIVTAVTYVILWPVLIAGQMAVIVLWVMLFSKQTAKCPISNFSGTKALPFNLQLYVLRPTTLQDTINIGIC